MGKVRDDAEFPRVYVNIEVCNPFVDRVKVLDTTSNRIVNEESNAAGVRVVARTCKDMMLWFCCPEFTRLGAPSLVDSNYMPLREL